MILPFSQQINGKPTYFAEKINKCLMKNGESFGYPIACMVRYDMLRLDHSELQPTHFFNDIKPKLHSIRIDEKNRWKAGSKIHAAYNNRTKDYYQFAPIFPCKSVQKIFIKYEYFRSLPVVIIDDKTVLLNEDELKALAINDGFESLSDFCDYFNQDFTGKIIHWTNLRY